MAPKDEPVKAGIPDYDNAPQIEGSGGGEGWHSDLPRVKFEKLIGHAVMFDEVSFRDSEYGEDKQYVVAMVRVNDADVEGEQDGSLVKVKAGESCTTSTGGGKIVDDLKAVKDWPARGTPGYVKTKKGYNMLTLT